MKLILLIVTCFLSLSVFATVDLSSGEARYVGGELVRCEYRDTTPPPVEDPWRVIHENCECRNENSGFPSLFLVTEYANGQTRSKKLGGIYNGDYLCGRAMESDSRCR